MRTILAGALAVLAVMAGGPAVVTAVQASEVVRSAAPLDVSAQSRRPRTRIIVTPRQYGYPGPGAVRHCRSWLNQEVRPSGTVIVPQMHCWWVQG